MRKLFGTICCIAAVCGCLNNAVAKPAKASKIDATKPRLVMVEVPSWKTTFFGLPQELPLLIQPGEKFAEKTHHYDFSAGMEAMRVFVTMRPKDKHARAYTRFMKKWPVYQSFFKVVDLEKYAKASTLLAEIQKIDPKEPAVHFYWGSLYTHLKKYQQAEQSYKQCLSLYPDYGPAYINLARLVKARGATGMAKHYLQEAVKRLENTDQEDARNIAIRMLDSLKVK